MMEFLLEPWPWYVVGPMISVIMILFLYFGYAFGISSSLKHMCTIAGAGKFSSFFNYDWKSYSYLLFFVVGLVIGGYITSTFLQGDHAVDISDQTAAALTELGIVDFNHFAPADVFGNSAIWSNIPLYVIGGLLIGFGTRYANGCTSGHAILGLSNLQWTSLIAVVGFFIGGIVGTYLLLPFLI